MKLETFVIGAVETNCYVVSDEDGNCVMIDCDGDGTVFFQYIKENQLKPLYLLLTHGHFDHTGAVLPIQKKYPDCKICIQEKDLELLDDSQRNTISFQTVKEGDWIEAGTLRFQVLETPGHTKGGVCYRLENLLFSGDTLFARDCGRVDLYGGDWTQMQASLKKLAALSGNPKVLPGHGPISTLQEEREENPYIKQD